MNIPPYGLHRKYTKLSQDEDDVRPRYSQSLAVTSPTSQPVELYEFGESSGVSNTHARVINISNQHHPSPSPVDYIIYNIQPGDTLHNLSVKYSCPVASIKRLNNLWTDQEFYGLTRIKLPVGKLRLLADLIGGDNLRHPNQQQPDQLSYPNSILTPTTSATTNTRNQLHAQAQGQYEIANRVHQQQEDIYDHPSTSDIKTSDSLFKDFDLNIEQARTAALSYDENASDIMQTLAQGGNIVGDDTDMTSSDFINLKDPNRTARREAEMLLNDMCDTDLSYNCLLLFIFIVCFICPIGYVIYLEEMSESRGQVPHHNVYPNGHQHHESNQHIDNIENKLLSSHH